MIDKTKVNCLVDHGDKPCPGYPDPVNKIQQCTCDYPEDANLKECACHDPRKPHFWCPVHCATPVTEGVTDSCCTCYCKKCKDCFKQPCKFDHNCDCTLSDIVERKGFHKPECVTRRTTVKRSLEESSNKQQATSEALPLPSPSDMEEMFWIKWKNLLSNVVREEVVQETGEEWLQAIKKLVKAERESLKQSFIDILKDEDLEDLKEVLKFRGVPAGVVENAIVRAKVRNAHNAELREKLRKLT